MKKEIKKVLAGFLTAVMIITLVPTYTVAKEQGQAYNGNTPVSNSAITVYFTSDMHGSLQESSTSIGLSKVAGLVNQDEDALLLDCGDATQGNAFASISGGLDIIKLMNVAGYDAMCVGNHEFDRGMEQLEKLADAADFPILGANVIKNGQSAMNFASDTVPANQNGGNTIVDVKGVKVGIFGLVTKSTEDLVSKKLTPGVTFEDEIDHANKQISELNQDGADVIICMTHVGEDESVPVSASAIAAALTPGAIDVMITGHEHVVTNKTVNGTLIMEPGYDLSDLGKVVLTNDGSGDYTAVGTMLTKADMENVQPDKTVESAIEQVNKEQNAAFNVQKAEIQDSLWGGSVSNVSIARMVETNLGDVFCDSLIQSGKDELPDGYSDYPVVAFVNGGSLRTSISNGKVTAGNVLDVLPFSNTLVDMLVSPKALYEAMEHSLSLLTGQDSKTGKLLGSAFGGFLQISGMTVKYNPSAEVGSKVIGIYLDGEKEALDKNITTANIVMVTSDYLAGAGNDYKMFEELKVLAYGGAMEDILIDYLKVEGMNDLSGVKNRIQPVSEYVAKQYTAYIFVKDTEGNAVKNKKITYYVDHQTKLTATTDANGLLSVNVADGPHAIKLTSAGSECYINNYVGIGISSTIDEYIPQLTATTDAYVIDVTPTPTPTVTPTPTPIKKITVNQVKSVKVKKSKKKLIVTYKKVSGAKGYQIILAQNKKFTRGKKIYLRKSNKITFTSLKNKTYYVKIRAYKLNQKGKKVYGKYSAIKKKSMK